MARGWRGRSEEEETVEGGARKVGRGRKNECGVCGGAEDCHVSDSFDGHPVCVAVLQHELQIGERVCGTPGRGSSRPQAQ